MKTVLIDVLFQIVRRCAYGQNIDPSVEGQEMACTLRHWEGLPESSNSRRKSLHEHVHESFSLAKHYSSEVLLTPIEYRDDVNAQQWSVNADDIIVVQRFPCGRKMNLVTHTGSSEFSDLTANGHDILLAFLQAAMQSERIVMKENESPDIRNTKSTTSSSVTSCLDVDTLQARQLQGRAAAETWPEKFSRRIGHVFSSLSELSSNLCDATCCSAQERDFAPVYYQTDFEVKKKTTSRKIWHMPSGLSVESDPSKAE
mgnify:CR=1 FL=1